MLIREWFGECKQHNNCISYLSSICRLRGPESADSSCARAPLEEESRPSREEKKEQLQNIESVKVKMFSILPTPSGQKTSQKSEHKKKAKGTISPRENPNSWWIGIVFRFDILWVTENMLYETKTCYVKHKTCYMQTHTTFRKMT